MAETYINYTVTSSAVLEYAFTFEVLDDSHVTVTHNGTELVNPTHFTVNTDAQTITLVNAPTVGDLLVIRRETPRTEPVVEFVDATRELAANLNKAIKQPLHIIQEIGEAGGGALALGDDGNYDAGSKQIKNVATPTADYDSATKKYADDLVEAALDYVGPANPLQVFFKTSDGTASQYFYIGSTVGETASFPTDSSDYLVFYEHLSTPGVMAVIASDYYTITRHEPTETMFIAFTGAIIPANTTRFAVIRLGDMRDYIGNADTATALATARTITVSGDVDGSASFDGTTNITINCTLDTIGTITPNTQFTSANVTVDAKGRVIAIENGAAADPFEGADGSNPGVAGLVPAPAATDNYKFLRGDGNWAQLHSYNGVQVFTSNGTFNVPTGISKVRVTVIGAGGGRNSAGTSTWYGGGGAAAMAIISVTPGASISVSVGVGGTSGFSSGTAGTQSSFGAYLVAAGGAGASIGTANDATSVTGSESASAITAVARPTMPGTGSNAPSVASNGKYGDGAYGTPLANGNSGIVIVEW